MANPLTDLWVEYSLSLERSIETGDINDTEISDIYLWPRDLNLTEEEKDDIKRFVHERLLEIVQRHSGIHLDNASIGSYIFRSVICGMMLDRQKGLNLTEGS